MKPYNHPNIQHIKKRTIKEETRSYLLHNKIAKPVKNLKQDTTNFKAIETEIIKEHPPH